MQNKEEPKKVFINELEKEFYHLVTIENNKNLSLVIQAVYILSKHGLFKIDRICTLEKSSKSATVD